MNVWEVEWCENHECPESGGLFLAFDDAMKQAVGHFENYSKEYAKDWLGWNRFLTLGDYDPEKHKMSVAETHANGVSESHGTYRFYEREVYGVQS